MLREADLYYRLTKSLPGIAIVSAKRFAHKAPCLIFSKVNPLPLDQAVRCRPVVG